MVELFFVVNDSITGEITDQKGVIHHDGWLKDGVHYVGLLATYPGDTSAIFGPPHLARATVYFRPLFFAPILAMDFAHEVSPPRAEPWPK